MSKLPFSMIIGVSLCCSLFADEGNSTPLPDDSLSPLLPLESTSEILGNAPLPPPESPSEPQVVSVPESVPFMPFTGKVRKDKVRLRTAPNTSSPIVRELHSSDLLLVEGEKGDFYSVKPPHGIKVYVFKNFIREGRIEGSRVNVRLGPSLEDPIVDHLSAGDHVEGVLDENGKWVAITPPSTTHFYVAKSYVEKAGDIQMMVEEEKRQRAAATLPVHSEPKNPPEIHFVMKETRTSPLTDRMKVWEPIEEALFSAWTFQNGGDSIEEFYEEQKQGSRIVTGFLEAYTAPIKNKPGDFILKEKDLPVAYLYSTQVDLQEYLHKKVTVVVAPRSNHDFAFPAYFVLAATE